ncbi:MAG: hypothetical protein PVJ21_03055 [Anaerolineales bacterium]|jgi:hypothetical protein
MNGSKKLSIGTEEVRERFGKVEGGYVTRLGEQFYCIRSYDQIPPFFMSVVSSSDHWMFISSTGGLSAGRRNAESALFPYYTDDKLTENYGNTGPLTVLRIARGTLVQLWEPFSDRYGGLYSCQRNLYKNIYGNVLIFEETNFDLGLTFTYAWRFSEKYGFVRTCWLTNDSTETCQVDLLDGLQNILPYGTSSVMQSTYSNLLDAYKRSELELQTGLGMFGFSSTPTDLAEPSEALKTTVAWQLGLESARYLLSTKQVDGFRWRGKVVLETDICGQRGAYLVNASFALEPATVKEWSIIAEVDQDATRVAALICALAETPDVVEADLLQDFEKGTSDLVAIIASADGLQESGDRQSTAHHFSNVLFNVMRGGIFADHYNISRDDLFNFVKKRNNPVGSDHKAFFLSLPEKIDYRELIEKAASTNNPDLERLCYEYLPLTFSRRHGDPSRPWNKFSINVKNRDGSQKLDYQGNWRDIFQNWEALAWSYPHFVEGMICKFVNATTPDGYNPYRLTRNGIDWAIPEPENPWENIGYWSDHQIIYLQKLLEISHRFHPRQLQDLLARPIFSYANVPYRIKPYESVLEDPAETISFNWDAENQIKGITQTMGSDGKLVLNSGAQVFHVTLAEKLLVLLLAKLTNLVPEGGIWMNTQRPEWNDANNALVGKGLSVVTLGYLRRYIVFVHDLLEKSSKAAFAVTSEVGEWFAAIHSVLQKHSSSLPVGFTNEQRSAVMDELGKAGSDYRWNYYEKGFSGERCKLTRTDLLAFLDMAQEYVEQSLKANKRPDRLFHAYNILHLDTSKTTIDYLDEMLEGQVSILSSGLLSPQESLELLRSMRQSRLYRADQNSYLLYPQSHPAGFLEKNRIRAEQVQNLSLVTKLIEYQDTSLISRDVNGEYHFNGAFRNAKDVSKALDSLSQQKQYAALVAKDGDAVLALFEQVFNHAAFTGRSSTFYAYEGMGSIYWHMVSKLLLAVQEVYFNTLKSDVESAPALADVYFDVRNGLGYKTTPDVYGAFPTDPYSHTPADAGAKQPGMTGQVKEEILTRFGELGLFVDAGNITFHPNPLCVNEMTTSPSVFRYVDISGSRRELELAPGSLAFTFCQVPVVYSKGVRNGIRVYYADGNPREINGNRLDPESCQYIFDRNGQVERLEVGVKI